MPVDGFHTRNFSETRYRDKERTGEQGMARNVLKIPEVVCKGLRDEKNLPAFAVPTGVFKIITCKFN